MFLQIFGVERIVFLWNVITANNMNNVYFPLLCVDCMYKNVRLICVIYHILFIVIYNCVKSMHCFEVYHAFWAQLCNLHGGLLCITVCLSVYTLWHLSACHMCKSQGGLTAKVKLHFLQYPATLIWSYSKLWKATHFWKSVKYGARDDQLKFFKGNEMLIIFCVFPTLCYWNINYFLQLCIQHPIKVQYYFVNQAEA